MRTRTVLIFGAGATKACGGPLTDEILPEAFGIYDSFPDFEREGFLELVNEFLVDYHHLPSAIQDRKVEDYVQLPLLLALLETAIDRNEPLGRWPPDRLKTVRAGLDYLVFALLQKKLERLDHNYYWDILRVVRGWGVTEPDVISLNYDIIVDNSLCRLSEQEEGRLAFPDYGTDISTNAYHDFEHFGRLSKLHGSLHWIFCPGCKRLYLGMNDLKTGFVKVLEMLYHEDNLYERYSCHGSACQNCGENVRPVLITPTYERDYANPHIRAAWDQARRMLRDADRAIIIGYSLPHEDKDVTYLLRQELNHLDSAHLTVIDYDGAFRPGADDPRDHLRQHDVGRRYRTLFGDELDWHPEGLQAWLASL